MKLQRKLRQFFQPLAVFLLLFLPFSANAQWTARSEIRIPDLPGYITLKCDFHMHTVFSDGAVWPTVRVDEAWREGLDAIAITDHIEYQPHSKDVSTMHGRAHELASERAKELGIILIRAAEITKGEPPGHFNALFLKDVAALDKPDYKEAISEAVRQGGFVFWNHPGWKQPERRSVWYAHQDTLLRLGVLHGMEVVNGEDYYPIAHRWCLEKNLTMLGNSDVHSPVGMYYNLAAGEHRPITLVFAKEKSAQGVKDALFAGRTAILWKDKLIGKEEFLRPIFQRSVKVLTPEIVLKGKGHAYVQISNNSDVNYYLEAAGTVDGLDFTRTVTLWAEKTVLVRLQPSRSGLSGERQVELPYVVRNLLVAPDKGLSVKLKLKVRFVP